MQIVNCAQKIVKKSKKGLCKPVKFRRKDALFYEKNYSVIGAILEGVGGEEILVKSASKKRLKHEKFSI